MSFKKMWDSFVRFGFGPRPPVEENHDQEAATSVNKAPSPPTTQKSGSSNNQTAEIATTTTDAPSTPIRPPSTSPNRSLTSQHPSLTDTTEAAQNAKRSHIFPTHSFTTMADTKDSSLAKEVKTPGMATGPANSSTDSLPSLPSSTSTDTTAVDVTTSTEPETDTVAELKETTVANLPPPGHVIKAKSQIQLVKARLLPIGEFVMEYKNTLAEEQRGWMEMRLW
jgi:hypothetical protein